MRARYVVTVMGAVLGALLAAPASLARTANATGPSGPSGPTGPPAATGPTGPTGPAALPACSHARASVASLSPTHRATFAQHRLHRDDILSVDGEVMVPRHGWILLRIGHERLLRMRAGHVRLGCQSPPRLIEGSLSYAAPGGSVSTPQGVVVVTARTTRVTLIATPLLSRVWIYRGRARVADGTAALDLTGLDIVPGDKALLRPGQRPRLDTWPFAPSPAQRPARRSDGLPAFWADGGSCSVGCRPIGAGDGWPIKPFHRPHGLRAGLNERRRANMHIGVDIQARDGTDVYAMQGGIAQVTAVGTVDEHVQVGDYSYWHVHHHVASGQRVVPYKTVIGTVIATAGHVHVSEHSGGRYLNPLRPGGRVLRPWADTLAPVIGEPSVIKDGSGYHATVEAFDPQSYRELVTYRTPVLAVAALAVRGFDATGQDLTGLRWALRGSQHYPDADRFVVYAHGAHTRGWSCFATRLACPPLWRYRLTDGLTPPLPLAVRRIAVYAYDWAGNVSVREVPVG